MTQAAYYPLYLDVRGRRCLVVGGGAVAVRKVRSLLDCGARITVVAADPAPALRRLAARSDVTLRERPFRRGDVGSYALVFGASGDPAVNEALSSLAGRRGIPVNVADDPERSTFIVPSVYRRGPLQVAVSTSGKSPAVARLVREELDRHGGPEYARLAALLGSFREEMARRVSGHRRRARVWKLILDSGVRDLLRSGRRREAQALVRRHIRNAEARLK